MDIEFSTVVGVNLNGGLVRLLFWRYKIECVKVEYQLLVGIESCLEIPPIRGCG